MLRLYVEKKNKSKRKRVSYTAACRKNLHSMMSNRMFDIYRRNDELSASEAYTYNSGECM